MNPAHPNVPNFPAEGGRYQNQATPFLFPGYASLPDPALHQGNGPWTLPPGYAPNPLSTQDVAAAVASPPEESPRVRSRSAWSSVEEEILIRLYKEKAEPLRKEGKRGQAMWHAIATSLNEECGELEIVSERTGPKCKEKFFNLAKKYKLVKDQMRVSGQGSEALTECEHFQALDEFMGSRDAISPRNVVESGSAPATPHTATASATDEGATSSARASDKSGKRPAERTGGRRKKARQEGADDAEGEWLELFREQNEMLREAQRREEGLFERIQEGERNCRDMIVTAIRELGTLLKKD